MIPTLVIGASENPDRYSSKAIKMLHHLVTKCWLLAKEKEK
jgi:hypothetical protein